MAAPMPGRLLGRRTEAVLTSGLVPSFLYRLTPLPGMRTRDWGKRMTGALLSVVVRVVRRRSYLGSQTISFKP